MTRGAGRSGRSPATARPRAWTTSARDLATAVVLALAWAALGELPSGLAVMGGVLVVLGVVAVQRLRDVPRPRASPVRSALPRPSR
jgi:hypothetical protein